MSRKRRVQIIAIVFLLIAVAFYIPSADWSAKTAPFAFISLICGTIGSIVSIFIPSNYVKMIDSSDWIDNEGGGYKIEISAKKHGLGKSPKCGLFKLDENQNYEMVMAHSKHDKNGNVTISANQKLINKVILTA